MLAFIGKILGTLPLTITSILGILQAVIKLAKEIITAVINILFPLFPDGAKFKTFVTKVRDFINKISDWFETVKSWLLKIGIGK
jgi:hypothetical protein